MMSLRVNVVADTGMIEAAMRRRADVSRDRSRSASEKNMMGQVEREKPTEHIHRALNVGPDALPPEE